MNLYKRNRKWLNKILLFSGLLILLASCTKLVHTNYNQIVQKNFKPSQQDLASLVGAAYVNWRIVLEQWDGYWRDQEVTSDEEVIPKRPNGWVDGGVYRRLQEHTWTADDPSVRYTWTRAYKGITNCNRVIYQIESGKVPVAKGEKASVVAQLKVLRASYYYVLCDMYGNVPIVTKFNVPQGFLPKQSTRKQVYDFIVSQIKKNLPLLSKANDKKTYGRFNQWAAHALLARMYLNAKVYSGTPEWNKAIQQCNDIINSGLFQLAKTQKSVFATNNQNSKEIIFAIPFNNKYVTAWDGFSIHMETLEPENQATYNLKYAPWGGICAIPQFINTFNKNDSRYKNNWIKGQQYSANGDSLFCTLPPTVGQPLKYINYVPSVDSSSEVDGFRLGKFQIAMGSTVNLSNDFPLFRYAGILMTKAECLLRTGHASEAAAIVTQVRRRDFPNNPSEATVTASQLMGGSKYDYGLRSVNDSTNQGGANIKYGGMLDQLGYEFCQEGRRRQDMIRFGVFTTKSWLSHKADNKSYLRLFPIPQPQLNKNPNLKQNPGY